MIGTEGTLSMAYHPQTDGQMEWMNQELEQYLQLYTNFMQDDWSEWLSQAEFAYNNREQVSTGFSPFFLEYSWHPHTPIASAVATNNPGINDFLTRIKDSRQAAMEALKGIASSMKKFADECCRPAPDYVIGDLVWLSTSHLTTGRPTHKLDIWRTGPFAIQEKVGNSTYCLTLPPGWRMHLVFHVSLLWLAVIDKQLHPQITDDMMRPPPDVVGGHEEYKVEYLSGWRTVWRQVQYFIKWKGYPVSESTWEPRLQLMKHVSDIILKYEQDIMIHVFDHKFF
jgi:hypothetical protein